MESPIYLCALRGHAGCGAALLRAGGRELFLRAEYHDSWTPLHAAVISRKDEMLSVLLAHGFSSLIDAPNKFGQTPLHIAARLGSAAAAAQLLAAGASIAPRDEHGRTAQKVAERSGHPDVAALISAASAPRGLAAPASAPAAPLDLPAGSSLGSSPKPAKTKRKHKPPKARPAAPSETFVVSSTHSSEPAVVPHATSSTRGHAATRPRAPL
mmetsp:Transcript_19168/g.62628  ORF Transcript_19168/g.62628 Transcript_19168/m.62628 type:complete len:212 (-) Transcript_19168:436-1071(-)